MCVRTNIRPRVLYLLLIFIYIESEFPKKNIYIYTYIKKAPIGSIAF